MSQKTYRIRTKVGDESSNIQVNLEQDVDLLEILSLKFSQSEVYTRMCADYGVVIGRVSSNYGFGIPNARVSIFVPLSEEDGDDPIISTLYPYKSTGDRNEDGYRYNLLPYRQSHSGHAPTGSFPDKSDVLYRDEVLEIYEKYYKYTVKTNNAGDFMIWGVPVGTHTIHVDIDMSDIGCFSIRPFDLLQQGVAQKGQFENGFKYKSSIDIDSLPQIIKFDKSIEVVPFWGQEDMCQIGITRTDFDFSELGVSLQPTALFIGSMVTDSGKLSVNKFGKPKKRMGFKCKLETYEGDVEAVRFTGRRYKDADGKYYPELEKVSLDRIDENGTWMCSVPMNMDYVITNEFGDEVVTNDPNQGVATSAIYRFRVGLDFDHPKMEVGYYLVPNIREFNNRSDGKLVEADKDTQLSYVFSDDFDEYFRIRNTNGVITHQNDEIRDLILGKNNNGIPEDYFYKFIYNKVYGVSSFHGSHFEGNHRDSFIGIKEILPNEDLDCDSVANKLPINFGFKNRVSFQLFLAMALLFFKFIFKWLHIRIVEFVGGAIWTFGRAIEVWPIRKAAQRIQHAALKWQEAGQFELPLTIYPVCEECQTENIENNSNDLSQEDLTCVVASGTTTFTVSNSSNNLVINSGSYISVTPDSTDCPSAQALLFSAVGGLQNQFVSYTPDGGTTNRYAIAVFQLTGSTANESASAVLVLSNPGYFFQSSGGGWSLDFVDRDDAIEFASEVDNSVLNNNGNVTRIFKFEIYDLEGPHRNDIPFSPEYEIEEGCQRYDTFYNESLLKPNYSFIWGTRNSDYGSPTQSIEQQNSLVQPSSPYGSGIYPASVLRYASYSDSPRTLEITGLIPGNTYDIKLVGSKRVPTGTTTTNLTTLFTIGGQTQPLVVNNNLTDAVFFTTIAPITDRITIIIDAQVISNSQANYNYINGFTITRNQAGIGSGIINVNVFSGIDPYNDPTWNDFSVGLNQNTNIEMFNLIDTFGITTGVNIKLSDTLNVTSNDIVSPLQKIFNSTAKPYNAVTNPQGVQPTTPYTLNDYSVIASVGAAASAEPLPSVYNFTRIGSKFYIRKTKTGFSEIRDGLIIIVPTIRGRSNNIGILKEWYNRTKISTAFCGGIVNHAFVDNWLTGILYGFKFKFKKPAIGFFDVIFSGRRFVYPRELVYYDINEEIYYYRSTPYDKNGAAFIGQRAVYAGKVSREILRPTTIVDLGPRDEFIGEICADRRVDPNCSVVRDITTTSYQDIGDIIEYAINYKMDITNSKIKIGDFFDRKLGGVKLFDGDIVQLESINCEAGIDEFDLDSPKYFMYNGELLNPDDPYQFEFFSDSVTGSTNALRYGPTPIDFKLDDDGRRVRLCLNHPDFLGTNSQRVPFYLWDKKGEGFGVNKYIDKQEFKKDLIFAEKLQRIYSVNYHFDFIITNISNLSSYTPVFGRRILVMSSGSMNNPLTGTVFEGDGSSWINAGAFVNQTNYLFADGTEEYVLYPMTKNHDFIDFDLNGPDAIERFDFVSLNSNDRLNYNNSPEGTIFLHVTQGTVNDPISGFMYIMKTNQWVNKNSSGQFLFYNKYNDDVFITPTANNYRGNLQVLSTPYQYYFGLRPGKTAFDRFITAFGYKGAFNE